MNRLSEETSPYLLQHKNNPVHWLAWNNAALQYAIAENKMMLVSIGYSACHWCHVMEHEVFEDQECAAYMNKHFVCIKVDREERPDVDSIYMDALHLMGQQGGWPLNVFTLPDGRPIYGGTYFPKQAWLDLLENLVHLFRTEPQKVKDYAHRLHQGLQQNSWIITQDTTDIFDTEFLNETVAHWSKYWDTDAGGMRKAPKFPMPNNWEFLLHYGAKQKDKNALKQVHLTLEKLALGGIYDQLGGGFSRYSVDGVWKVPHFEKMLYDNAQLVALYAQAYRQKPNALYAEVVHQTIGWLQREMLAQQQLYYAALDADSEAVEGKFYTWDENELKTILADDFAFASKYYCIGKEGFWEHDQNILLRRECDEDFAAKQNISVEELKSKVATIQAKLMQVRDDRIRPALDDKCITSWNALLVTAFCEAHKSFPEKNYLCSAIDCAENIVNLLQKKDGTFFHTITKGQTSIDGFLDDYAFAAEAFLELYEVSGDEKWLHRAEAICKNVIAFFYDENDGLFFFTSSTSEKLIARKKEIQDNVIPSSNSAMCKVLFKLSIHFMNKDYLKMCKKMLSNILPIVDVASAYSNWLQAYQWLSVEFYEIVVTGDDAQKMQQELNTHFLPNAIIVASTKQSSLPLFQNRFGTKSAIYVCSQNQCLAPVFSTTEALGQIQSRS